MFDDLKVRKMRRQCHKLKGSDNYMKRLLSSLDEEERMRDNAGGRKGNLVWLCKGL